MASVTISQAKRPIEIQTPLGKDVLGLRSFVLREQLGRPFVIEAEFSSDDPDIKFEDITGHAVVIRLNLTQGGHRSLHAIVARFVQIGQEGPFFHYQATLSPWLWTLTRSADCRMFQTKSVLDVVQQVFRDRGVTDFELRVTGSYPTLDYCVQYRETDFNFVSRLLEQDGIAYYFKHNDEKGMLILADDKSAYEPAEGCVELPFRPTSVDEGSQEVIKSWRMEREVQPAEYALNDYNYLNPRQSLRNLSQNPQKHGLNDRQIYDYPGEYLVPAEGERLARVRLEELQATVHVAHAETTCLALSAGNLVKLVDHPRADQNAEHLITALTLYYDAGEFLGTGAEEPKFSCHFTAIPSTQPFRPARITPKPVIHGPQPAVVVGPSGEEIHTDAHGRVKLHFFWDRDSKANENSSCWVRVSQGWAGKKWGSLFLPRIGHEVLVEFMEGDPDRPIVTGSVFNADNKTPYDLPGEKTKSTLKSNSSKGGAGFNEIRFEDKKGGEQIFVHAEKDEDVRVKNDSREWIGRHRHLIVTKDQYELVEGDKHGKVKGDHNTKTEGDRSDHTVGGHFNKIDGADHLKVGGVQNIAIGQDYSIKIGANSNTEVATKISAKAGTDIHQKAGTSFAVEAGTTVHIKAGASLVIEAGAQLSLKVGGNFVDINAGGVFIKGAMVMINTGGAAGSGGGSSPTAPTAPEAPDAPKDPKKAADAKSGDVTKASATPVKRATVYGPAALVLKQAAKDGTPFCEKCEAAN